MQDVEYIKTGYRINFNTIKRVLRSLVLFHNESVNIWSHLLGVLMLVFFVLYVVLSLTQKIALPPISSLNLKTIPILIEHILFSSYNITSKVIFYIYHGISSLPLFTTSESLGQITLLEHLPKWPLLVHIGCGMFCLLTSTIFHTFFCHSKKVNDVLNKMDYFSISIFIGGSALPPIVYGFACNICNHII